MSVHETVTSIGRLMLVGSVIVPLLVLVQPDRCRADQNSERVQQLKQRLDTLEGRAGNHPVDSIVGNWFCTNNAFSYNINFLANGQLVGGDAFLGNSRGGDTWVRLSEDRICIPGGPQFEIRFDGPDNFSFRDVNVGSTGTCKRQ